MRSTQILIPAISIIFLISYFIQHRGLSAENDAVVFRKDQVISDYFEKIKEHNRYENPDRDSWQKPLQMIAILGQAEVLRRSVIADIGSGTGYFTMRLAPFFAKVIAVDVSEKYLNYLKYRIQAHSADFPEFMKRIELRKADFQDPGLKPGETDFIILSDSYHHLENRTDYFRRLRQALKQGGKILIIDWLEMDRPVGPPRGHGLIPPEIMKQEIEAAGFRITEIKNVLKYHTVMIAE